MKKMFLLIVAGIFFANPVLADDIFVGYTNEGKERYISWSSMKVALANLAFDGDNVAEEISKTATKCMNDKSWYKGELLSVKSKDKFYSYKFKFHWLAVSSILYVDIDNGKVTCSKS